MAEMAGTRGETILLELPCAEQFVVWATRTWVAGLKEGIARSFSLQRGFDLAGIPDGLNALDGLLGTIATGAARTIDIRCVQCRWFSDDERAILAALAGCQTGASPAARGVFECFLVPAAARVATEQADDLACELSRAKLLLRQPVSAFPKVVSIAAALARRETVH